MKTEEITEIRSLANVYLPPVFQIFSLTATDVF